MSKSKKIRYAIIFVLGIALYTFFLTGATRVVYTNPNNGKDKLGTTFSSTIYGISETSRKVKAFFKKPSYLIANTAIKDGFTYYSDSLEGYPKLIISYKKAPFDSKIQLLDIKTGRTLKEWTPDSKEISRLSYRKESTASFAKGADLNFEHPVLFKDSSVVFNTGYSIVKINSQSEIEWINNTIKAHHSIELNQRGNLYISGRNFKSDIHTFISQNPIDYQEHLLDDQIMEIDSKTGKVLSSKSVIHILKNNGYLDLLYNRGDISSDPIHLNNVQPALYDGDFWKKGDLLISCRNISTVFLYRPDTDTILWLKQGPWRSQHDPSFYKNDNIVVFGNDVVFNYSKERILKRRFTYEHGTNEVYIYNFNTDSITTPYSRLLKKELIKTPSQGNCTILPNGDIFIEETDNGRIIFGDTIHKKIEFAKRIDTTQITALNWSRIIN